MKNRTLEAKTRWKTVVSRTRVWQVTLCNTHFLPALLASIFLTSLNACMVQQREVVRRALPASLQVQSCRTGLLEATGQAKLAAAALNPRRPRTCQLSSVEGNRSLLVRPTASSASKSKSDTTPTTWLSLSSTGRPVAARREGCQSVIRLILCLQGVARRADIRVRMTEFAEL